MEAHVLRSFLPRPYKEKVKVVGGNMVLLLKVLLLEKWSSQSLFFEILIAPCASLVTQDLSEKSNVLE